MWFVKPCHSSIDRRGTSTTGDPFQCAEKDTGEGVKLLLVSYQDPDG